MATRAASRPDVPRRGAASGEAATKACTSASSGRRPSSVTVTHVPATGSGRRDKNNPDGSGRPRMPASLISKQPISSVAPYRFLTARTNRRVECRSPSNWSTTSTTCSSSRGPAMPPSLVTCPTRMVESPRCLASAISVAATARTWVMPPAAGDVDGAAGGITQVRAVAATLIALAKQRGLSAILVGHVTKDGGIAGPRLLEHVVDVVLQFEGERHSTLRLVRAVKNRYGATDEIGCFEMSDAGIRGLPDPSGLFLSRRPEPVAGTCVTVTLEGRRPLLAEVQALVAASPLAAPRRGTSGLDAARVAMVLAVLERRGRVPLASRDVYTATVGGQARRALGAGR